MLVRALLIALIAWGLALPLRDILTYPDRVSVLPNLQTDAEAYYMLGRGLAEHWSLAGLPPRHPPGWIVTLAATFAVAGPSYVAGKVVLWVALVACVAGCAWIAFRLAGGTAAWIAALLCAGSGSMRGYVGTVQYEVFTAALLLGVLVLAVRAVDATTARTLLRRTLATGVLGGILILTRETFAIVLPLIAGWMAHQLAVGHGVRRAAGLALLMTAVSLAPAAAWTLVQSVRFGGLVTISEKGPITIELGHNPLANGTYNAPLVGIGQPTGLAFALANPGRELVLSVRKVLYFWGVLRDGWNVPRPAATWMWRASTGLVPLAWLEALARGGWLLVLFLVALWVLGRAGLARWWILPGVVLMLMAAHILTLSSHRFAVPTLPVTYALVSAPLAAVLLRALPALRSWAVIGAIGLLLSVVVAMQRQPWPLEVHLDAAELDGLLADNRLDVVSGRLARVADAQRGVRPFVLLADQHWARGRITIETRARLLTPATSGAAAMRVVLQDLSGRVICATEASAGTLLVDRFAPTALTCDLPADTVATLAVFGLGTAALVVDALTVTWHVVGI